MPSLTESIYTLSKSSDLVSSIPMICMPSSGSPENGIFIRLALSSRIFQKVSLSISAVYLSMISFIRLSSVEALFKNSFS